MAKIKISELDSSSLNEKQSSQLTYNLAEMVELSDTQMGSIAGMRSMSFRKDVLEFVNGDCYIASGHPIHLPM